MADLVTIENRFLARVLSLDAGRLRTHSLHNKLTGRSLALGGEEFLVELDGPPGPRTDLNFAQTMDPLHAPENPGRLLGTEDFAVEGHQLHPIAGGQELRVWLRHPGSDLSLQVVYTLGDEHAFLRKRLELSAGTAPLVTRLEVERLTFERPITFDQPAFMPNPHSVGNWYGELRLGQPLLGEEWFFGLEHPAGHNRFEENTLILRHFPGRRLDHPLVSKSAVSGAAVRGQVCRAFRQYLMGVVTPAVRERRVIIGAHSWNATDVNPNEARITAFAEAVLGGLGRHGLRLDYLEIDCGWAHPQTLWEVDARKFPRGLDPVVAAVEAHGARLGLWYSPGGVGALQFNPQLGLEPAVISGGVKKGNYCVAAPRHRQALLEVIRTQVRTHRLRAVIFDFFSGVCGGEDHGHLPHRPYSLEAMLDAHFELIAALRQEQEDLWVIDWESPTFAFSPWLLMHVDAVWLGWSDAAMATGMPTPLPQVSWMITGRDAMTFREARCLDGQGRFVPEPFPPWATDRFVFNDLHEPQHEVGRPAYYGYRSDNLIMGLSRGGLTWIFWPLPEHYQDSDYAFFASALRWGQSRRVVLSGMRPLLGDPEQRGAYAYGNFEQGRGIVTVRNPFARSERFSLALGERLGMEAGETSAYVAQVVYPYHAYLDGEYRRGDTLCGEIPGYQAMTIELVHRDTLPGPVPLGTRARSEEGQWVLHGPPGTDRIVNWLHPDGRREEMLVCFPGSAGALQVPVARLRKTGDSVLGVIELEIPAHYTDCMLLVLAEGDTDEPVFCRVDHYDDQPGTLSRPLTERSPRDPTFMGNPYNMPVPNWTFFSTPLGRGRHRLNVSLSCSERQGWARGQWVRPLRGWVSVWLWTREPLTAVRGAATSVSAAEPLPLPMAQDVDQQLVALIPPTYVNTRVVASETIVSV